MSATGIARLVLQDLGAARGRATVSTLGIALGVWVLAMILALGIGIRDLVLREIVRELPVDMLEVVPKTVDLGLFKLDAGRLLGTSGMGPDTAQKLRSLPEVLAVYPKQEVKLPLGAQGGAKLFGHALYTDLFMTAIAPELLTQEGVQNFVDQDGLVPVAISSQLIELYNGSVATALGTPQLSPEALRGFRFDLVVGRSMLLGTRGARTGGVEAAQIVGVSHFAMPLGITVPTATAARLLKRYGADEMDPSYSGLFVRARAPADLPHVVQVVEGLGFAVDNTAQRTRRLLEAGTALGAGVGALVLTLASLHIAHSFLAQLRERRRELAILRSVGATRTQVVAMVLGQATLLGLGGACIGCGAARLTAAAIDALMRQWVPHFPFRPTSFFAFSASLYAAASLAALAAAWLGALVPAWREARRSIVLGLVNAG